MSGNGTNAKNGWHASAMGGGSTMHPSDWRIETVQLASLLIRICWSRCLELASTASFAEKTRQNIIPADLL